MLYRFEGKLLEARAAFSESLKVFEKLNNKYQVALSQFELGRTYAVKALDYPDGAPQLSAEAAGLISRAIDAFAALGAQPDMARARMALMGTESAGILQPAETSD